MPKCLEYKKAPILTIHVAGDSEWGERVVLPQTDISAAENQIKEKLASESLADLCDFGHD